MSEDAGSMPIPGSISWTEIPVQDMARVQKFYGDVFGWKFTPVPAVCPDTGKTMEPGSKVVMFQHGKTHGSFIKLEPEMHLSPAMYPNSANKEWFSVTVTITVESIEESLKKIEGAGGKVYKPKRKIPGDNMGHHAYFVDSEQNVMGLWSIN